MAEMLRTDFGHWVSIPVRWGDVDRMGHVNNVQYFRYSEEARTQWIDAMSIDLDYDIWNAGQGLILAELQCRFIYQLRHPATVHVGTRVLRMGNSSMQVLQGYFDGDAQQPVASAQSRLVWFDYKGERSIAFPELVRQRIRQTEIHPPEE